MISNTHWIILLVLSFAAVSSEAREFKFPLAGACVKIDRNEAKCPMGEPNLPDKFNYEIHDKEMSLDWNKCKGKIMKHAYHFKDKSCGLGMIQPEGDDLALLMDSGFCDLYYRCKAK